MTRDEIQEALLRSVRLQYWGLSYSSSQYKYGGPLHYVELGYVLDDEFDTISCQTHDSEEVALTRVLCRLYEIMGNMKTSPLDRIMRI